MSISYRNVSAALSLLNNSILFHGEEWKKGDSLRGRVCVKESGGKGEERSEEGISFSYVRRGDRSFEKLGHGGGGEGGRR